ncbi:MAG: PAS domain S-box protein, partial [Deltaproteobacteria bacterium]|nr:PAS domain S-box protein [Deltaproteobacteria bacterium]
LVHPDDRSRAREAMTAAIREGRICDVKHRIVRRDGELRHVHGRGRLDRLSASPPLFRMVGTLQDVTENERAQRAIEASERKFREVFESSLDAIAIHSAQGGRYLSVNPQYERLTGFTAEELLGRTSGEMKLWIARDIYRRVLGELEATGRVHDTEAELRRKSGERRWVLFSGLRVDLGGTPCVVSFTRDVTERRRAEQALRDSEERYRELFDGTPLGVYRSIPEGSFEDVNPAFLRMFGAADLESVRRLGAGGLYADPAKREELRALLAERGVVQAFEIDLRRLDGSVLPASVSARAIRGADGAVVRYEGIVEDVSLRQAMEEDLRRARDAALKSERLKSTFLANMSHEIRTPLNVILGFAGVVADHLREIGDHSQDQFIDAIQRAGKRLMATIHGILDISRFAAEGFEVRPAPVELAGAIDRQLQEFEPLAAQRGLRLVAEIDVPAIVRFDEYCLSQALGNLIDNAIKFTRSGEISVRLRPGDDGSRLLEVADTGVGIDAAFLPRLFDAFSQEDSGSSRHFEGSGLGLALVKNYLESNGASIMVESEKGEGSIFRIRFPPDLLVSAGEAFAAPAEEPRRRQAPGGEARPATDDKPRPPSR